MKRKKLYRYGACVAVVALLVGVAALMALRMPKVANGGKLKRPAVARQEAMRKRMAKKPETAAAKATDKKPKKKRVRIMDTLAMRTDLSAAEKKLLQSIDAAMETDDFEALMKLSAEASKSSNPEIRSDFVDALGWFGAEGLLELLPFMSDRDETVATSALDNWTFAIADVEDEKLRGNYVENAMRVIKDRDSLEAMVMGLDDCADLVVVQTLVDVIEQGENPAAVAVAKEHYEFTTGEPYTGFDDASNWVEANCRDDDD